MLSSTLSKQAPFIAVKDENTLANAIVDAVRDPLVVLDHDLRVIAASRSFYSTFWLVRDEVRGHLLYEIDGGQRHTHATFKSKPFKADELIIPGVSDGVQCAFERLAIS